MKNNDDLVAFLKKIKHSNNRNNINNGVIQEYFRDFKKRNNEFKWYISNILSYYNKSDLTNFAD